MIAPRFTGLPHASPHRATLAARAREPVAYDANVRNPVGVVERVNAYGLDADVVSWHRGDILLQDALGVSRAALLAESA